MSPQHASPRRGVQDEPRESHDSQYGPFFSVRLRTLLKGAYRDQTAENAGTQPSGSLNRTTPLPVSPNFGPNAAESGRLQENLVLLSSDSIAFHTDEYTLLRFSSNNFKGLLPLVSQERARRFIFLPDTPSSELEIMLQAIYNYPESDRRVLGGGSMAEFSTLCRGVNWLPTFGIPPKSVITTNKHLFSRILAYAPLYPLEVYALAGHHDLKGLASATSPYTLSMELSTMKQELAEEMGAVYLLWLFRLHTRRQSFLLTLFATPPDSHEATERCLDQRELKQKWNMVIASLTRHMKADTPSELIREHVAAHTNNITCKDCAKARDARLDAILNEWARADRSI